MYFSFFCINAEAFGDNLESREFYISESILIGESTPRLQFEKDSNLKWFEEKTSLISGGRTEVGIKNLVSSYTLAYRNQNLNGIHNGRGAKFECFSLLCSWIDTSIISGIDKSEQINYRINLQQIWVERLFENSTYSVGLIAGINVIGIDLNISSSLQNYHRSETAPIPFFGISSKYKLRDKLHILFNVHHFEAQKNNKKFVFHDSEIELNLQITKFLRASIGNSLVYLNLQNKDQELNAEVNVPQINPYIKFTFFY